MHRRGTGFMAERERLAGPEDLNRLVAQTLSEEIDYLGVRGDGA